MSKNSSVVFTLVLASLVCIPVQMKALSLHDAGDLFKVDISGLLKPEMGYAKNANLINNDEFDTIYFMQNTLDLGLRVQDKTGYVELYSGLRNRFKVGDPSSTSSTSKVSTFVVDSLQAPHSHASGKNFVWIRELWMRWDLGKLFGMPFKSEQFFTIGLFPFQVGRGIALGDVFAAGPELLGFYSETYVDQYAFGILFSGDVWSDWVTYAVYAGLLKNKNSSFRDIQEKIYGSRYGHRDIPQRGFGDVDYVIAGYLDAFVLHDDAYGSMRLQPYFVFNQDNGQTIEFLNDAKSILGTIGLEGEYLSRYVEFGFEMAFNTGQQQVLGWDRNVVRLISQEGLVSQVNSHVTAGEVDNGNLVPYVANGDAQNAIFAVQQTAASNDQQIPGDFTQIGYLPNPDGEIFNTFDRFRDPYCVKYKGWMGLADLSFWVIDKDLRLSFTGGAASGGLNPHTNIKARERDYTGFIPLQEAYSGKRVKSAFFMGSNGKIQRPIANPLDVREDNVLTHQVSGFTNLVFAGAGLSWTPTNWEKPIKVNPNVLAYWLQQSVPKLTREAIQQDVSTNCLPLANPYLGVEMNVFVDYNIVKNLKIFGVISTFIPGTFYSDIKGRRAGYREYIEDEMGDDNTGFTKDKIPKYGDSIAWTLNLGLEYRF